MKKIKLNGAQSDNAGRFNDAGATLTVGKDAEPGMITVERAKALVDRGGAVPQGDTAPSGAGSGTVAAAAPAQDKGDK